MNKNTSQGQINHFLLRHSSCLLPVDSALRNARALVDESGVFLCGHHSTMVPHAHISSRGRTIGTLVAAVQRRSVTPASNAAYRHVCLVKELPQTAKSYCDAWLVPMLQAVPCHFPPVSVSPLCFVCCAIPLICITCRTIALQTNDLMLGDIS
jgi:hypothetical protein